MNDFLAFETLQRRQTPNDYLLAPPGMFDAPSDAAASVFACSPEALFDAVLATLKDIGTYEQIEADPAARAISAVDVTRILRFRDDIDIRILPAEQGATLAVYSRSRLGAGDMGANRKRVEKLMTHLSAAVQGA